MARRGVQLGGSNLVMAVLAEEKWTGDKKPKGTVAFYGVGGEVGLRTGQATGVVADDFSTDVVDDMGEWYGSGMEPLLHFRNGAASDSGVQRSRGPDVGEAELSLVHFSVWAKKYWGKSFDKWLVTSVDTDQLMIILLAMNTGKIEIHGPGMVDVTVQRIVGGVPKSIWVNRAFTKIG